MKKKTRETKFHPEISAAIRENDTDLFKHLLLLHPDHVDVYTPFGGGTWLHVAASGGNLDIVKHLLDLGIDINVGNDPDGRAALANAAANDRYDVVEYLLDHGAKMDTTESVRNPLFAASSGGHPRIARLLIDRGIDTTVRYNGPSMKNMDAMAFAMMWGQREIARMIAEKHAGGDPEKIKILLAEADAIAEANTTPLKSPKQPTVQ